MGTCALFQIKSGNVSVWMEKRFGKDDVIKITTRTIGATEGVLSGDLNMYMWTKSVLCCGQFDGL